MIDLNEFLLKSSIILLVFYLGYWFLLRKTTHFKLSRFYLLSGLLLSLSIPFMHFSIPEEYPAEVFVTLDSIEVGAIYASSAKTGIDYTEILQFIYFSGAFILSFRLIFQLYLLFKLYLSSKKELLQGKIILRGNKNNAAFSFFNLIFINEKDCRSDEFIAILRHESVHVAQKHSVDILFAEALLIVLWFNPFAWLYVKSIKANHEYLADEGVVQDGFSANRYLEILFEQSSGLHLSLANNFNQSLTFKRLNMMKKIKSSKITQFRVLVALPVIIAMLAFVSCSKELLDVQNKKSMEVKQFETKSEEKNNDTDGKVFFIAEKMPEFPGGELGLRKYIAMNVKYPHEARKHGLQGKVYVRFVVTKTGNVDNVTIARGVDSILNEEALRVVSTLPKWEPAMQKGVPVSVYYTIPINFALQSTENDTTKFNTSNSDINMQDKAINFVVSDNNKLKQDEYRHKLVLPEAELENAKKQLNNAKSEKEAENLIRKIAELEKKISILKN
ncbi:MAG: M56 family metallopeptidase [Bacteroidales bacterium]|nr:M56 family metallopeptidase [Bacteroidales bacterium]